ncbi:unnamed protein product [Closterium sp. Naga37s-1]|nr:unnamed protein product [Closterium sp. Naga37s-1]
MFPNRFVVRQPRAGPAAEVWAKLMERDAQLMQMLANRRMLEKVGSGVGVVVPAELTFEWMVEKVMATNDLTCTDLDKVTFAEPLTEEEAEQLVGLAAAHAIMQGAAEGAKGGATETSTGESERMAKEKEGEQEERREGKGEEKEGEEKGKDGGKEDREGEVEDGESDGGELVISAKRWVLELQH